MSYQLGTAKVWSGTEWVAAVGGETPWATISETPTGTFNDGTDDWNYWIYKSSGTLTVEADGLVDYLVVAGGGTGAAENTRNNCGAGGAGGVIESSEFAQISAGSYAVTVGAGGSRPTSITRGNDGNNSSIGSLAVAIGGGGGGARSQNGRNGGCGGSSGDGYGSSMVHGGEGTFAQGYRGGTTSSIGGTSGGGGGAGQIGGDGNGVGGNGRIVTIISTTIATAQSIGEVSGSNLYFAGGGGGGDGGTGGLGGGGNGAPNNQRGTNCPANTGGGSGNSDVNAGAPYAGAGGSGVVIVRTKI